MDVVRDLINLERWSELGAAMDRAELEVPDAMCAVSYPASHQQSPADDPLLDWPCALHLLAHIYSNHLCVVEMISMPHHHPHTQC